MIQFINVIKSYELKPALDKVTCKIEKGEFVMITGASGAGKSTFLKLIFCEEHLESGDILLFGKNIAGIKKGLIPFLRRNIGFVFQDFRLIKNRTVYENVALAMEILGKNKNEIRKKVTKTLSLVELSDKTKRYPSQLSGGEQQRVSIARAVINNPSILLADEPTGNLDDKIASGIVELMKEINAKGTTVLVASHKPSLFDGMKGFNQSGKRFLKLDKGKLITNTNEFN